MLKKGDISFLIDINHYSRCDADQTDRPCIFKQLIENDKKKSAKKLKSDGKLTEKLEAELRHLLIDKEDLAEKLCMLGSTSHCEANHARIINRGWHNKGKRLFFSRH